MLADYTFDLSVRWENYKVKFGIKYPKTAWVIEVVTLIISIIFVVLMFVGVMWLLYMYSLADPSGPG